MLLRHNDNTRALRFVGNKIRCFNNVFSKCVVKRFCMNDLHEALYYQKKSLNPFV